MLTIHRYSYNSNHFTAALELNSKLRGLCLFLFGMLFYPQAMLKLPRPQQAFSLLSSQVEKGTTLAWSSLSLCLSRFIQSECVTEYEMVQASFKGQG